MRRPCATRNEWLAAAPTWLLASLLVLLSCSQPEVPKAPTAVAPPQEPPPAVTRTPVPEAPTPMPPSPPEVLVPPPPQVVIPPGAAYVCVTEAGGKSQQTVIEFTSKKVLELCRKHPEMGPCQYERELCRNGGGRVFAADGTEITQAIEDEYDKKVMRVRFRASDPTPTPARKQP